MKTVWIMNHYASSMYFDEGGRHYNFAKYLKKAGYHPVVFGCNAKHGKAETYFPDTALWQEHMAEKIDVPFVFVRGRTYQGNGKQRVLNMIDFYRNVKKTAKAYAEKHGKPDVIYASSVHPLTLVAGIQLAKKFGVKCICEVRDLWPESIVTYSKRFSPSHPIIRLLYCGEKWIYKKADALIFTMEGGYDYIKEKGWQKEIPQTKAHYINNGVDLEQFDDNCKHFQISDADLNDSTTFKVVYTGSLRPANGIEVLLDCAEKLTAHPNIRILIFGGGEYLEVLRGECERRGLTNCIFKGAVAKQHIPYILTQSDVNVLNYAPNSTDIYRFGSSQNKLFEYLASGKPILSNVRIAYNLIERYQCGIVGELSDGETYAQAVLAMSQLPNATYQAYCDRARSAAQAFDFKILTEKLINVIEGMC